MPGRRVRPKTKEPGSLSGPGSQGSVSVALGSPSGLPVRCHGHVEVSPYEDATSTEPCLPSITGPPPSWACASSAGPNPPGSVGRPSLFGTATSLQVGGVDPRHNNMLGHEFPNVNGQDELASVSSSSGFRCPDAAPERRPESEAGARRGALWYVAPRSEDRDEIGGNR